MRVRANPEILPGKRQWRCWLQKNEEVKQAWANPEILPGKLRGYDAFGWKVDIERLQEAESS